MLFILTIILGFVSVFYLSELLDSGDSKLIVPISVFAFLTFLGIGSISIVKNYTLYFENKSYGSHEVNVDSINESNSTIYQLTINDGTQNITKYYNLDVNFSTTGDKFKKIIFSDKVTKPVIHGYISQLNNFGKILNMFTFEWRKYEILLPKGTVSFSEAETLK